MNINGGYANWLVCSPYYNTHTHTGPYSSTEDLIVHEITVLFNNKQHNCVINIVIYLTVLES